MFFEFMKKMNFKFFLGLFLFLNVETVLKKNITIDEFDTLLESGKIFFVDFYATWCGPCQKMLPVYEKVANENKDVIFVEINIDDSITESLVAKYGVRSIPTLICIGKDKKIIWQKNGFIDENSFRKEVNSLIS